LTRQTQAKQFTRMTIYHSMHRKNEPFKKHTY